MQGEVVHWLACSLYAACRKGSTPTVGKGLMEGNCVSLTRILRTAKLRSVTVSCDVLTMSGFENIWQITATTIYTLKGVGIIFLLCIYVKMNLLVQLKLLWGVCSLSSITQWVIIQSDRLLEIKFTVFFLAELQGWKHNNGTSTEDFVYFDKE